MSWPKYMIIGLFLVTCCKCSPIGEHGDREKRTLILGVLFKKLLFQQALSRNFINLTTVAPQRNMQGSRSSSDMTPLGEQQNLPGIATPPQTPPGDQAQQGEPQGSLPPQQQMPQGQPPQGAPPQGQTPQEAPPQEQPPQVAPPQEALPQGSAPEEQPQSDLSLGRASQRQGIPSSQGQPPQGLPSQEVPSQGPSPQRLPSPGLPSPGQPPQGLPPQRLPPQGLPPQGLPPQGLPPQGLSPQGLSIQGSPPQGQPPQGPQAFPFQQNPTLQIPPNYSFGLQSLNVFGPQRPLVFPPNFPFGVQRFRQLPFGPAPPLGAQAGPQGGSMNLQFGFGTFSPTDSSPQDTSAQYNGQAQPTGDAAQQQGLEISQAGPSEQLGSDGSAAQGSDPTGSPAPLPDQDSSAQPQSSLPPQPQPQPDLNGREQQQAQPDFNFELASQQPGQSSDVSQGPPPSGNTDAQQLTVPGGDNGAQFQFGTGSSAFENGLQQLPPNFFFDRSAPGATATSDQQNGQRGLPENNGLPPNFNFGPLDNNLQQQFDPQSPQSQQQSEVGDASQPPPTNGFPADNLPPNFQLPNGQPQSDQAANGLFEPSQFAITGTDNNVLDFSQQSGSSPNGQNGQQQQQQPQQSGTFPNNFQQFSPQSNFGFGNQQFDASEQFQGNPFQQGSSPNGQNGQQQQQQPQQSGTFPNNFQQFSPQSNFGFGNQQFDASEQFQGNPFQQGFF